uniref:Uncharacterized protein n=1 Tax=Aegilops tauschii subsp. strangulata TaxID=200361 RepID=A0A453PFV2_AEGTS
MIGRLRRLGSGNHWRALICQGHLLSSQGMSLMCTLDPHYGKEGAGERRRRLRWVLEQNVNAKEGTCYFLSRPRYLVNYSSRST